MFQSRLHVGFITKVDAAIPDDDVLGPCVTEYSVKAVGSPTTLSRPGRTQDNQQSIPLQLYTTQDDPLERLYVTGKSEGSSGRADRIKKALDGLKVGWVPNRVTATKSQHWSSANPLSP